MTNPLNPPTSATEPAAGPASETGLIVVGIDDSPGADHALRWAITEADMPIGAGADPAARARQATEFGAAARACVRDTACDTFVAWGLTDRYTWWTGLTAGGLPAALLFDADGQPKPALAAVHDALRHRR